MAADLMHTTRSRNPDGCQFCGWLAALRSLLSFVECILFESIPNCFVANCVCEIKRESVLSQQSFGNEPPFRPW